MWWILLAAQLLPHAQDSLALLKAARNAQADFESFRVSHLPWSRGASRWGQCDVVLGRFCFWYEEDPAWRPAPEPPAIEGARLALVRTLDSLATRLPGDEWIAGQRIRYLVEAGDTAEALAAARACRAAAWWCGALAGYGLHEAGRYAAADSAFAVALAAMPAEQRCQWTDLSSLLGDLRGAYRALGCAGRDTLQRRLWWLADPLYMVPGNERRTEHYARRVLDALQEHARSAYDVRWGRDLEELTLRYGWPIAWERELPEPSEVTRRGIISHNDPRSWHFLPPAGFVESPHAMRPGAWDLKPDRPRSSYAPPYATAFHELPHQIAVFHRGDSMVVVAGYDVRAPEDSAGRGASIRRVRAALVLQRGPDRPRLMARSTGPAPTGVLLVLAPAESTLVSLETLDTADSTHAARERFWLPAAPRGSAVGLSDPLLFRVERPDSLPSSLADAVGLALGSPRVRAGERVGVFWETYGLVTHPEPFRVTLTVTRESKGLLQQVVEWAGLARRDDRYVSLSWEEPPHPGVAAYPRALALALPQAATGRYLLEITVQMSGQTVARARRELVIEKP